jgi:hypothetical protein
MAGWSRLWKKLLLGPRLSPLPLLDGDFKPKVCAMRAENAEKTKLFYWLPVSISGAHVRFDFINTW